MEWNDLEKMTVVKLREEATTHGIKGVHGMVKAKLMDALADVLGIEKPHAHFDEDVVHTKGAIKKRIKELKVQRDQLIEAHDHKGLREVRRKIHRLKRKIRKIEHDALVHQAG